METNIKFGTFSIPKTPDGNASFTVPGIFPKDFMNKIFISKENDTVRREDKSEKQVTHERFFGENISRVKDVLKK